MNIEHISTGDLLRESISSGSIIGLQAAEYIDQGKLVPSNIISDIIKNSIKDTILLGDANILFDGYPRNADQAKELDNILYSFGKKIDLVIELAIYDRDILIDRMIERNKLSNRTDDNVDIIKDRLEIYYEEIEKISDYYTNNSITIHTVAAHKNKNEVFGEIMKIIAINSNTE